MSGFESIAHHFAFADMEVEVEVAKGIADYVEAFELRRLGKIERVC